MGKGVDRIAIINRSFWPCDQILGDALLQFAELMSVHMTCYVVTQSQRNFKEKYTKENRGTNITLRACRAYTNSSNSILSRILEALYFVIWTFFCLVRDRPTIVYISTDPPIIVPFFVSIYCKIFGAKYVYHLQDIHPEIANSVVPIPKILFSMLYWLDNVTLRGASKIITISDEMKSYIANRSKTNAPIYLLDNAAFFVDNIEDTSKNCDVVFCGNIGRLQRISLITEAINEYLKNGGKLKFTFIGGGIYKHLIERLANDFEQVTYLGKLPAKESAEIVAKHRYALLPIEDEITRYAFPSKSSSYVISGCYIVAICSETTSVSRWVVENKFGSSVAPGKDNLISYFHNLEKKQPHTEISHPNQMDIYSKSHFAQFLTKIMKDVAYATNYYSN